MWLSLKSWCDVAHGTCWYSIDCKQFEIGRHHIMSNAESRNGKITYSKLIKIKAISIFNLNSFSENMLYLVYVSTFRIRYVIINCKCPRKLNNFVISTTHSWGEQTGTQFETINYLNTQNSHSFVHANWAM